MSPMNTMVGLQGAGLVGRCRKARVFSRPIKRWKGALILDSDLRCGDWYYVVGCRTPMTASISRSYKYTCRLILRIEGEKF